MAGPGWLNAAREKDRVCTSQIKKSLELSKGLGTHSSMFGKSMKSFKRGILDQVA